MTSPPSRPLVLDLDGTLLRTDTFHEMMAHVLRKKPWVLCLLPFWLWKSRAYAKIRLAEHVTLDPRILPYNPSLLAFVQAEAEKGRPLLLATGTNQRVAETIAAHFGFFQEVIGSDEKINMTGQKKQRALLIRFGAQGFDYAGDSLVDHHVWQVCEKALVVHPKKGVLRCARALKKSDDVHYFPREKARPWALFQALRPLFWSLNLLLPSWPLFLLWSAFTSGLLITGDLLNLHRARASKSHSSQFAEGHLHLISAFLLSSLLLSLPLLSLMIWERGSGFVVALIYAPLFLGLDSFTRPLHPGIRWIVLGACQLLAITCLN